MVAVTVPAQASAGPIVWTDKGAVRGVTAGEVRTFEGIPFAAPPTGDRRWRQPAPAAPWSGVRDATRPRANCMQSLEDPVPGPQSEDCLYLNVTSPRGAGKRPVLIWLYGGGFYQGSASEYGAKRLAAGGDVVVVTAGYRLGIFGFLGLPGLAESGGFGLADQQAAMRWVRRNIAAFGGDPGNVTLVGESAGSMSTCAQLTSPTARGLFHRAIMQSGTCLIEWPTFGPDGVGLSAFETAESAREIGSQAAAAVGCADVTCLRGKPTEELLEGMSRFSPAVGNSVLPEHPAAALRAGRFHRVPVLVGTTRDESTLSITGTVANPLSPGEYSRLLDQDFGPFASRVAERYPPRPGANGQTYAAVNTDRTWAFTTWQAMREFAARVPTYAFEFADRNAPVYPGIPDPGFPLGAYHGSDVQYLFDIADFPPLPTEPQRRLAADMIGYWSRFAAVGDPDWPRWPHVQSLAPGAIGAVDYFCEHRLDFWSTHGSNRLTSPNSCQR